MLTYVTTRTRRGPTRRRLVILNHVENRLPGRAAFLVNLARIRAAEAAESTRERSAAGSDHEASSTPDQRSDTVDQRPDTSSEGESSPYEDWTKGELYDRARELDISGRSKMNKDELIEALQQADKGSDRC